MNDRLGELDQPHVARAVAQVEDVACLDERPRPWLERVEPEHDAGRPRSLDRLRPLDHHVGAPLHLVMASTVLLSSLSASLVKMSSTQCGRHQSSAGCVGLGSGPL
eukprot:4092568-Prymnesium_polylepis.1